jgi:hypothetical protein
MSDNGYYVNHHPDEPTGDAVRASRRVLHSTERGGPRHISPREISPARSHFLDVPLVEWSEADLEMYLGGLIGFVLHEGEAQ